jgi:2',3'-cyclic-nucleotide 2'-phosphodiesterase (5'-nucleotidase family)
LEPVATAREWIPKARKECDVLIAVTHIGVELDVPLAMRTKGIDAIVGGDSHTFLYKPLMLKNAAGVKVPIVQDGEFGVNLGRFDLHFELGPDDVYHLTRYSDELIPVGADIPEAPDVVAKIDPYVQPLREVVGTIPAVGSTPKERSRMTATLVADALRTETKSDMGLCKIGGLFEVFRHPQVTRYDIWAAMPFKNNVATAAMPGARLKEILGSPDTAYSGVGSAANIDPARTYSVAMVDYEAAGPFKVPKGDLKDTGLDLREVCVQYLKSASR